MKDLGIVDFNSISEVPLDGYNFNELSAPTSYIGHVFAVKTRNGLYAKVRLTNAWIDGSRWYATVDWAVQKDGSNKF